MGYDLYRFFLLLVGVGGQDTVFRLASRLRRSAWLMTQLEKVLTFRYWHVFVTSVGFQLTF